MTGRVAHLAAFLAACCALPAPLCSIVCVAPASASPLQSESADGGEDQTPCHEEPASSSDPVDCRDDCLEAESVAFNPSAPDARPPISGVVAAAPASSLARCEVLALWRGRSALPPPDLLLLKSTLIL